MPTITVTAYHPFPTYYWEHATTVAPDSWQDASLLSGYSEGQYTESITVDTATPAESGWLRCTITNPENGSVQTELSELTALPSPLIDITQEPQNLTIAPTIEIVQEPVNLTLQEAVANTYAHDFSLSDLGTWTHNRGSIATGHDYVSDIIEVTGNTPMFIGGRYDGAWHDEGVGYGIQLEGERTNYAIYSNDPSQYSILATVGITLNDPHMSPDGLATSSLFEDPDNDGAVYWGGSPGNRYGSLHIASPLGEGDRTIFATSSMLHGGLWTAGENWQRVGRVYTPDFVWADFRAYGGFTPDATKLLVWGAQVEDDGTVHGSSYIPTNGTQVTRNATELFASFSDLDPLPSGGVTNDFCGQITYRMRHDWNQSNVSHIPLYIGTDDNADCLYISHNASTGDITIEQRIDGINQIGFPCGNHLFSAGQVVDIRFRKHPIEGMTAWVNGTEYTTQGLGGETTYFNQPLNRVRLNEYQSTNQVGFGEYQIVRLVDVAVEATVIEGWPTWVEPIPQITDSTQPEDVNFGESTPTPPSERYDISNATYVGAFAGSSAAGGLPTRPGQNADDQNVGSHRNFALNKDGNGIFVKGKQGAGRGWHIAEMTIPTPAPIGTDRGSLPVNALRQNWIQVHQTDQSAAGPGVFMENPEATGQGDPDLIGSMLHLPDGRLIVQTYLHYPSSPTKAMAVLVPDGDDLTGSMPNNRGYWSMTDAAHYCTYFVHIPPEHRANFGNREWALASSSDIGSRTARQTMGPSLAPFDESSISVANADAGNWDITDKATTAMRFPYEQDYEYYPWGHSMQLKNALHNDIFNARTQSGITWCHKARAVGGIFVPNTKTYLVIGKMAGANGSRIPYKSTYYNSWAYAGTHPDAPEQACEWCVGAGYLPNSGGDHDLCRDYGDCRDPDDPRWVLNAGYTTTDPYDNQNYYWMFSTDDLAEVYAGNRAMYDIEPYEHGVLNLQYERDDVDDKILYGASGVAYDEANDLLYIALEEARQGSDAPLYVVYKLNPPSAS